MKRPAALTLSWGLLRSAVEGPAVIGAWLLVALAISARYGSYDGLLDAVLAGAPLVIAVVMVRRGGVVGQRLALVPVLICCWALSFLPVTFYLTSAQAAVPFDLAVATATIAVLSLVVGNNPTWRRISFLALVASGCAGAIAAVRVFRVAHIDVWYILQNGASDTLHGRNMFTDCLHVTTDEATKCVYPYFPGTTIAELPSKILFGDVRYTYVLAVAIAAWCVYRLARPDVAVPLAALMLVYPHFQFGIQQTWNEPLLIAALAGTVLAAERGRPTVAIVAFAVALATKQQTLLLIPLAAWWPAFGWRRTAYSVAGATVACLPWIIAAPGAFYDDTIRFNAQLPDRYDSLSIYTYALRHGLPRSGAIAPLLTLATIALVMWWLPRTTHGFTLGSACVIYVFTVFNKHAFFNHYSLVMGLLVLAAATASRAPAASDASPERSVRSRRDEPAVAAP